MQVYDTCRAGAILDVRVGRSVVTQAVDIATSAPNTLNAKRDHINRINAIAADTSLSAEQKRDAVTAKNEKYAKAVPAKDLYPDKKAEHQGRLDTIAFDTTMNADQKKAATDEENTAWARDSVDENQDGIPDETQDIIHVTLVGGEKRSILRSDLLFAPAIVARRQADFPPYAQRQPLPDKNGVTGPNSLNSANTVNSAVAGSAPSFIEPNGPGSGEYATADQRQANDAKRVEGQDVYPRVGDFLVEKFDLMTDTYVQKVYDAATFARYFKASLN